MQPYRNVNYIYIYTVYIYCFAHVYDSCAMTPNYPLDGASCWLECIHVYCKDYKKEEKYKHLEGGGIIYTIYTCICIYILIHTYLSTYMPTYLHTYIQYYHVYIYIFTQYVCIYERYICIYIYIYIYDEIHVSK